MADNLDATIIIANADESLNTTVTVKWESIDLKAIKISAEQAVKTAEQNGDKNARDKMANECFVTIDLLPDGVVGYSGWTISYQAFNERSSLETIFEALINSEDGNFQVVVP